MRVTLLGVLAAVFAALFVVAPAGASAQSSDDLTITASGGGPLQVGATLDQVLAEADGLEIGEVVEIFPGTDGYPVRQGGALFAFVSTGGDPDGPLDLIILINSAFRTADGVGPGTLISDAVDTYGAAQLAWLPDDRGQESVTFADQPNDLLFSTSDAGGPRAGVYTDEATETDVFKPEATISTVWVDCRTRTCPPPRLPSAAADDEAESDEPVEDDAAPPASTETSGDLPNTGASSGALAASGLAMLGAGALAHASRRILSRERARLDS